MRNPLDVGTAEVPHIESRAVAKGGSVVLQAGRDIINGDVFSGSFARLRDVWLDPAPVFDEVQVDQFAGREWLIERIDRFIRRHDRGYVVIQAPAGIGKTMVAAWLAQQRGWPCHFTRRRKGRVAATALRNLAAQIIAGYQLSDQFTPGGMLPETSGEPGWFEQVLRAGAAAATAAGERLVLVVDGLDEAETFDGDLPLGLPGRLPRGVIMVVTCRTGSQLLGMRLPWEMTTFDLADHRNLADMRLFLQRTVTTDAEIARCLAEAGVEGDEFADRLLDRCGGVWVYLRYILDALRLGLRSPLDLDELPSDLVGYYTESLRPAEDGAEESARVRLLVTLAAVTEPLPAEVITELAGLPDAVAVERLCAEQLRPFLTCTVDDQGVRRYGIYHLSLRDYLHGADPEPMLEADRFRAHRLAVLCRAAHSRIADLYLDAFGGLSYGLPLLAADPALAGRHGGYPLRNLALHLDRGRREPELHDLLAAERPPRNVWYAAHDRAGSLADYVTDIERAQRLVAGRVDADVAAGRPAAGFALELRYTMMKAAVVSLTDNMPPLLVARLVEAGEWSVERALGHCRQVRSSTARAGLLSLLLPHLSAAARESALAEAVGIARAEKDPAARSWSFVQAVVGHPAPVPMTLLRQAVAAVADVEDDDNHRAWAISELAPRLGREPEARDLLTEAIGVAAVLEPEGDRAWTLRQLVPYLNAEQLAEVIAAGRAMTDDYARTQLIEALAPAVGSASVDDLFALARAIEAHDDRATALIAVSARMSPADRAPVVAESLDAARVTGRADYRAVALATVAAATTTKSDLLDEALSAAAAADDVFDRVWSSIAVAEHLDDERRKRVVADCLAVAATAGSDADRAALGEIVVRQADAELVDRLRAFALSIGDEQARVDLLTALAENCDDRAMDGVLTAIRSGLDRAAQARPLTALARRASAELSRKILEDAGRLPASYLRFDVVNELAPRLPSELLGPATDAIRSITDEYGRALLLARLGLPDEAVITARRVTYPRGRASALTRIARRSPERRPELLAEALTVARSMPLAVDRFGVMEEVAEQSEGELRQHAIADALAAARDEQFSDPRSFALAELARLAPAQAADLMLEAITAAREHPDTLARPLLLAELAGRMPATPERRSLLREATGLAREAASASRVIAVTLRIIDFLPEPLVIRYLATVREFVQEDTVSEPVGDLVRMLPGPLLDDAIEALDDLPAQYAPGMILATVVPYLPRRLREGVIKRLLADSDGYVERRALVNQASRVWTDRIGVEELDLLRRCLDGTDLGVCFELLTAGYPLLDQVGGAEVREGCLDGVRSVLRWWPRSG